MAKRCAKCGAFMMDEERFCPKCGENVGGVPNNAAQSSDASSGAVPPPPGYSQSAGYTYGTQQPSGQTQPQNYSQPYQQQMYADEEMSVGRWVGTILLTTMLGLISVVLLIIWGFGSTGPECRRRYCKAMLIVYLIGLVISIIAVIILSAVIASSLADFFSGFNSFFDSLGDYESFYEQFENAALAAAAFVL